VFPEELFPVSEPVLLLDNVVLSPHLAGAGREARIRQNLQRILQCSACRPR
jgi:phosphoglycerate dehydrogenase-like enzyme